MTDGAQKVREILESASIAVEQEPPLISDGWSGLDLATGLRTADIANLNAHFTHYLGISAAGYAQWEADRKAGAAAVVSSSEFLTSSDIGAARSSPDGPPLYAGRLVFSMGVTPDTTCPTARRSCPAIPTTRSMSQ